MALCSKMQQAAGEVEGQGALAAELSAESDVKGSSVARNLICPVAIFLFHCKQISHIVTP